MEVPVRISTIACSNSIYSSRIFSNGIFTFCKLTYKSREHKDQTIPKLFIWLPYTISNYDTMPAVSIRGLSRNGIEALIPAGREASKTLK